MAAHRSSVIELRRSHDCSLRDHTLIRLLPAYCLYPHPYVYNPPQYRRRKFSAWESVSRGSSLERRGVSFSHLLQWHDVELAAPLRRPTRFCQSGWRTTSTHSPWPKNGRAMLMAARDFLTLSVDVALA